MSPLATALRLCLAAAVALAAFVSTKARAADAPAGQTIVVISLVGDEFTVAIRRYDSSTRNNPNEVRRFPVADAVFDRVAMSAAEAAIQKARPGTNVLQASIRDARLFAAQDRLLQESPESQGLRAAVRDLLAKYGAHQLLLVTKRRAEASFELVESRVGGGMLEGLGFYVDNTTSIVRVGSNERSAGFLSPYAYATVSLLDAATMRTIRSQAAKESTMALTVDSKDAVKAWDSLGAEAKVEALERALRSAVDRATTAVLE